LNPRYIERHIKKIDNPEHHWQKVLVTAQPDHKLSENNLRLLKDRPFFLRIIFGEVVFRFSKPFGNPQYRVSVS
jgi:hypothetical protein